MASIQIDIGNRQLKAKDQQRTPCVIVVDASVSMRGDLIREVNEGLIVLEQDLNADMIAKHRVRVLVIRAGGDVSISTAWSNGSDFNAPLLAAYGSTPLGQAMELALQQCEEQKARIEANGMTCTIPWIFVLTDGEPNDPGWQDSAAACRRAELEKKVFILPFGTEGANFTKLQQFTNKQVFKLKGAAFEEYFRFVARSVRTASVSAPSDKVQLRLTSNIVSFIPGFGYVHG